LGHLGLSRETFTFYSIYYVDYVKRNDNDNDDDVNDDKQY